VNVISNSRQRVAMVAVLAASAVGAAGIATLGFAATTKKLSANPQGQLKYNVTKLAAKPGKVTLVMSNPSSVQHNVAIKGNGIKTVKGKVVGKGGTSKATASLKKGAYTFFCSVPGHEKGGMKGRLTVK
jgi:plastocyanin